MDQLAYPTLLASRHPPHRLIAYGVLPAAKAVTTRIKRQSSSLSD